MTLSGVNYDSVADTVKDARRNAALKALLELPAGDILYFVWVRVKH